jgi:hypothetical protein
MFYTICGQQSRTPYPAKSVFAFNANEVWVAMYGDQIAKIENGVQTQTRCLPWSFTINKIWGSNSNDLYAVGDNGNITHYNGTLWTRFESGTDVDLLDVWGSPDGSVVWACGYYREIAGTYLLRSTGSDFEMAYDGTANEFKILQDTISGAMTSVYTPDEKRIFVCTTSGVYNSPSNTKGGGKRLSFTPGQFPGLPNRIRGNGINDFVIVGEYSFIGHYNGYSWRYFDELWTDNTRLWSVSQKDDIIVSVGSKYLLPWYGSSSNLPGKEIIQKIIYNII